MAAENTNVGGAIFVADRHIYSMCGLGLSGLMELLPSFVRACL